MIDEIIVKIARGMFQLVFLVADKEIEQRWEYLQPSVKRQWSDKAESLIGIFEQLGYRKVTEPPLLSDEAIEQLINKTGWGLKRAKSLNLVSNYKTVAEAQRQSDIKHNEGESKGNDTMGMEG